MGIDWVPKRYKIDNKYQKAKIKRETKEVGTELCPGKGVLKKRDISKHQVTLSLPSL